MPSANFEETPKIVNFPCCCRVNSVKDRFSFIQTHKYPWLWCHKSEILFLHFQLDGHPWTIAFETLSLAKTSLKTSSRPLKGQKANCWKTIFLSVYRDRWSARKKHFRCSAGCTGSASENHFFKLFPADVQLAQWKRLFLESFFSKISQNSKPRAESLFQEVESGLRI